MKNKYSIVAVLFLVITVSCRNNEEKANPETPVVTTPANSTPSDLPVTNQAATTVPSVNIPTTNTVTPPNVTPINITPTVSQQPVTASTAKGLNPAHGQPGHRCDIAVGAPLNSPPAQVSTPTVNTNTPPTPSISKTAPVINTAPAKNVAAGMNPEHGQPGHRCDIAVGEPLSTPVKPNYTPPVIKQ